MSKHSAVGGAIVSQLLTLRETHMRYMLTAAAIAMISFAALSPASAEPTFVQGGPSRVGNMCNISTNGGDSMYGYVTPCAPAPVAAKKRKKS